MSVQAQVRMDLTHALPTPIRLIMSTIEAFIDRHPLLIYYVLTFSISWGGMLLVIGGPSGLPGTPEQADRLMGIAFSLMAGPSVAGLLSTGFVSKRDGLRDLFARLRRWRVEARWYAIALLTSPLLATVAFVARSWRFAEFPLVTTDDKASLVLQAVAAALAAGLLAHVQRESSILGMKENPWQEGPS